MKSKTTILSFTTYLPSPINPLENDISLRIYDGLKDSHEFLIFKSLNILPFFSSRYADYKRLKKLSYYSWDERSIRVYTLPNFKDPIRIKILYFGTLYRFFFKKRISDVKFDAIHSNNVIPDFLMGVHCSRQSGKPHFCTVRGKQKDVEALLNLDPEILDGVKFCTPSPNFLSMFHDKGIPITFIPHGINDKFFEERTQSKIETDQLKFIIVNRLLKMKQIDVIIDFFYYLKAKNVSFHCSIIGDGDQRDSLASQIQNLGLTSYVDLEGQQSSDVVASKLQSADFYFTNSLSETFGLSIVEALAAGCIVVGPKDIGVIKLFNTEDFFIELNEFDIVKNNILSKSKSKTALKMKAVEFANQFKWSNMLQKYKDFLTLDRK